MTLWDGRPFTDLTMATNTSPDQSNQSLWLSVKVVVSSKVLFGSILPCSGEESFGQLLSRTDGERFADNHVEGVKIEGEGKRHEIQLDAPLKICSHFACKSIEYNLTMEESRPPASSKNAFEILMSSQNRILMPKKISGENLQGRPTVI